MFVRATRPLTLAACGVDEVVEERDDVAALVVLLLLHLLDDLAAGLVVGLGQRLVVELLEVAALRRPVGLRVGRRCRLPAATWLRYGRVPQKLVANVRFVYSSPQYVPPSSTCALTVTPAAAACSANTAISSGSPAVSSGANSRSSGPPARPPQQRLRLLDVLFALREVRRGSTDRTCRTCRCRPGRARRGPLHHLVAVADQPHRLAHAHVVERCLVDGHRDRQPVAALRLEDLEVGVALDRRRPG